MNQVKQGYLSGQETMQIINLLIMFRRTGMERNNNLPVDTLYPMTLKLFYSFEKKNTKHNRFDNSNLKQMIPVGEGHNVVIPDYMILSYVIYHLDFLY